MKYTLHNHILPLLFVSCFFVSPNAHAAITETKKSSLSPVILAVEEQDYPVPTDVHETWFFDVPYLTHSKKHTTIANPTHCLLYLQPCALTLSTRQAWTAHKETVSIYTLPAIEEYIATFSEQFSATPTNARLAMTESTISVVTPHQNGIILDVPKNSALVYDALTAKKTSIPLEVEIILADVRSDNIDELGLNDILGEGRSDFAGSSSKRIHNIKTAASKFDNMLIAPGDTFSFVTNLGAVNGTTGYVKEFVIRDNKTVPEYGGGVCQVSTTIFRGAVHTGMKISERRNHSYAVKYYAPMGFDATIYLPAPDMKFVNNTDHYILLDTWMEGTELVFRYYGTDDGRTTEMNGPVVTYRGNDGSAKTYFTQTVKDKDGNVVIDDTFYSNYKSPKAYPKVTDTSIGRASATTAQEPVFTSKPKDWSKKEWNAYRAQHGI